MKETVTLGQQEGHAETLWKVTDDYGVEREFVVCGSCLAPMPESECALCKRSTCSECLHEVDGKQVCKECSEEGTDL